MAPTRGRKRVRPENMPPWVATNACRAVTTTSTRTRPRVLVTCVSRGPKQRVVLLLPIPVARPARRATRVTELARVMCAPLASSRKRVRRRVPTVAPASCTVTAGNRNAPRARPARTRPETRTKHGQPVRRAPLDMRATVLANSSSVFRASTRMRCKQVA